MELKRIFTPGSKKIEDCRTAEGEFNHLAFLEAGGTVQVQIKRQNDEWHISPRIMEKGVSEGWMSVGAGRVTLHTPDGDVVYLIAAPPKKTPEGGEDRTRNFYDLRLAANG